MITTEQTYECDVCGKTRNGEGLIGWWQITNPGVDIRGLASMQKNEYEVCSYRCMDALAKAEGEAHIARTFLSAGEIVASFLT